jgi:hypothetical protein
VATAPPVEAELAILGPVSELVRRVEIYEKDGATPWQNGAQDGRLIDGSVTIDYSRNERRAVDLTLDNTDFGLKHDASGFWYDKIIKVFCGVHYVDTTPVVSHRIRTNRLFDPDFHLTGSLLEQRRNLCIDPRIVSASGWSGMAAGGLTTAANAYTPNMTAAVGDIITISCEITAPAGSTLTGELRTRGTTAGSFGSNTWGTTSISIPAGTTQRVSNTFTLATGADGFRLNLVNLSTASGIKVDRIMCEKNIAFDAWYFDGSTTTDAALGWVYSWVGTANASESIMRSPAIDGNFRQYNTNIGGPIPGRVLRVISRTGAPSGNIWAFQYGVSNPAIQGEYHALRLKVRTVGASASIQVSPRLGWYNAAFAEFITDILFTTIPNDDKWVEISIPSLEPVGDPAGYATPTIRTMLYSTGTVPAGTVLEIKDVIAEKVSGPGIHSAGFFSGATQDFGNRDYSWSGTVDNSTSLEDATITTPTATRTTWETQVGEFMIDNIKESHFPYVVKVTGRDYTKKCLLSKFVNATAFAAGTAIELIIKAIAQNAGVTKFITPLTGKVLANDTFFERGTDRWTAMSKIAESFGYELFFDAQGYLVMREFQDPVTAPLAYILETGAFGNMTSYEKSVNDTRIYNHIVVTGESSDSETIPVMAEAINTEPSSPTNIDQLGDRVYPYSSAFITTEAQAQDLADKYLKIMGLEEFDLNFGAIALPWLEVGEIIQFNDPREFAGQPTRFLLSSLSVPLGLGEMSGNAKRVSVVG